MQFYAHNAERQVRKTGHKFCLRGPRRRCPRRDKRLTGKKMPAICPMAESIQQKLFDAAYALNLSAVKKHLKAGASLKKGDKDGCDVLYHAISSMGQGSDAEVQKKQKALVEFLVSQGADLNKQYKFLSGWTPVIMAASGGQIAALEVLLQAGADFEKTDDYKFTALMRAALNGQAAAVKQLLEKGAEVLKKNGLLCHHKLLLKLRSQRIIFC